MPSRPSDTRRWPDLTDLRVYAANPTVAGRVITDNDAGTVHVSWDDGDLTWSRRDLLNLASGGPAAPPHPTPAGHQWIYIDRVGWELFSGADDARGARGRADLAEPAE